MRSLDTDASAHGAQITFYRRIGPEGRVALAVRLSDEVRALAADGIRRRHPDYDETAVRHALLRQQLGDDLFRRAWPGAPLLDP